MQHTSGLTVWGFLVDILLTTETVSKRTIQNGLITLTESMYYNHDILLAAPGKIIHI